MSSPKMNECKHLNFIAKRFSELSSREPFSRAARARESPTAKVLSACGNGTGITKLKTS
jgi:hypothetical protein